MKNVIVRNSNNNVYKYRHMSNIMDKHLKKWT